ncbi:hypothetical protein CHS0354_022674 [Potamilus streckersoni]|uniref:Uncharacterized protein n=1 Tax=Potamilus streckersoni TaxID=2493646 RepID=A0AAE0S7B0_9BIVA|nr:hypothetical protein CHS0354_022674 [Potamilus streckersoni]
MAPLMWSFLLVTLLYGFSHAVDGVCYGPPQPCICQGETIDCSYKNFHLSTFPRLSDPSDRYNILNLGGNVLNQIPSRIFENITVHTIILNNCNLDHIDVNAFGGTEEYLTKLDLRDNLLGSGGKSLPIVLVHLRKLQYLDVSGNGFHARDYSDNVMRSIGASLNTFIFGDSFTLTEWPISLRHLQQLVTLDVEGGILPFLPADAFHGFEITLKNLTFNNVNTYAVPLGIASLRNLVELHLDNLKGFSDSSLIEQPFQGVGRTLRILSLRNDGLTVFPVVIKHLLNLKELSLDGNSLQFISDESIALLQQREVTLLSLRSCDLSRVPGAISNIHDLQTLDLSNNKITSIEQNDLYNMANLNNLSLAGNPLEYVSNKSFSGLNSLQSMDLSSTSLIVISQAIEHLDGLVLLDLTNNKIDCTCDLVWLKRFLVCKGRTITILGNCETIYMGIEDYVSTYIPNCLAYRDSTC